MPVVAEVLLNLAQSLGPIVDRAKLVGDPKEE
jgi:hypothetical protein